MDQKKLNNILEKNRLYWIKKKKKGKRADLRRADLRGADLRGADLRGADLRRADLRKMNLRETDLRGTDLRDTYLEGANLTGAKLEGAKLEGANLTGANLSWAKLRRANLTGANLEWAKLTGANLMNTIGNGMEIKSIQITNYNIVYTAEVLQIGCENHPIEKWKEFLDRDVCEMDGEKGLIWWREWKDWIFRTIEKSPAKPTKEDE